MNTRDVLRQLGALLDPVTYGPVDTSKSRTYLGDTQPLDMHSDGRKVLAGRLPDWTPEQHLDRALALRQLADELLAAWNREANRATRALFGRDYSLARGDYQVAGVGRADFPDDVKEKLRTFARGASEARSFSRLHGDAAAYVRKAGVRRVKP